MTYFLSAFFMVLCVLSFIFGIRCKNGFGATVYFISGVVALMASSVFYGIAQMPEAKPKPLHTAQFYFDACIASAKEANVWEKHKLEATNACVAITDRACQQKGCSDNVAD